MDASSTNGIASAASPPDAAGPAVARGWDVYEISRSPDPHARWAEIREATAVLHGGDDVWFVPRWAEVNEILRDPRHGAGAGVAASFGDGEGPAFRAMRAWLMSLDGPPHDRTRGLVRREFTPRRVAALEPTIRAIVEERVVAIEAASGDRVDLIAALARPVPSEVVRTLFGLPASVWAESVEPWFGRAAGPGVDLIEGLVRFFEDRLRSEETPEGLLRALHVPAPELGALAPSEIVANAVLLVTAAIDTTTGLLGNAIRCVLERPALRERLRREPALAAPIVEETLRFEPPALSCSRTAGDGLRIDGQEIPVGAQLLLGLAAAGRDPRRYERPDRFDPDRDATGLLSFGGGRHFCLGAALARLEARVVLERLLVSGSCAFEPIGTAVWDVRNPTVRAQAELVVEVRPRATPRLPAAGDRP